MAFDAFLSVDGIAGESTDSKHTAWIEILSYSMGVSQSVSTSASTGGARSGERCDHGDFTIMKVLDKASPSLFLTCCEGTHIATVTLQLCRATGSKQQYMEFKMEDVLITSYQPSGSSGGEIPVESVSFNYAKITLTYTPTDEKTGKASGNIAKYWDQTANEGG